MSEENVHLIFLYEDIDTRDQEIARFLNEGLRNNELCIYATVDYADKERLSDFCSKISQCDKNVANGNLLLVDHTPSKLFGAGGYLAQYEYLKRMIDEKLEGKKNQKVRWVGDFTSYLFQNRYFDECMLLEEWVQKNRNSKMTILCLYNTSLLEKSPHKDNLLRLFKYHDNIIDSSGKIISKYTY